VGALEQAARMPAANTVDRTKATRDFLILFLLSREKQWGREIYIDLV
jgi:hypothetical protein